MIYFKRKYFSINFLESENLFDTKIKNAEIGQYLNGAVPGRADCILASILFLLNLEEDTRIAKELKSSENLMSYLVRFESLVHRKESDPKMLELRIESKPTLTQRYIAIGLTRVISWEKGEHFFLNSTRFQRRLLNNRPSVSRKWCF